MNPQLNQMDNAKDTETTEVPKEILEKDVSINENVENTGTDFNYTHKILWENMIVFIAHHTVALLGFFYVLTLRVHPLTTIYSILLFLIQFFGLTMGVHRYFSHRSFKVNTPLRRILFILYVLNGQHTLRNWVHNHRLHHKYSDTDGDPHNAKRGFIFSHTGWYLTEPHPKVIQYSKGIDMSDIDADSWIMFQHNHFFKVYLLHIILTCIFPVFLWNEGAFKALCVCFAVRTFISLHISSSVNSLAHMFGTRPYDKSLLPAQNKFVAFLAYGEGWHNYHHAFPYDYRASELGMKFNPTTYLIDFCAKMGWLYDRKEAAEKSIMSRIIRTGDNSLKMNGNLLGQSAVQ